jgi:3-hydroxyacyl-CoA dehydrogenase
MVLDIARDGDIAVLTLDNPPVNALSTAVRRALMEAAGTLDADPQVRAAVLICAGRTFVAGADVREFGQPPAEPLLPDVIARIERAAKPWVAAIHGAALGGGLELALGCRFRVAAPGAQLGLPEVNLGIVPGAGGTVRTPRAIGADAAAGLASSGQPIDAARARELGLIDAVLPGELRAAAIEFARAALGRPLPAPLCDRPVAPPPPGFWEAAEARTAAQAGGATAPGRALACVRHAAEAGFDEALAFERATFLALRDTDEAAALRRVFFAERAALRPAALKGVAPRPVARVGLIGAGPAGRALLAALARTGVHAVLVDADPAALDAARAALAGTPADARAETAAEIAALAAADLVIATAEAAPAALAQAAGLCGPATVLARLCDSPAQVAELAELPDPARCLGLHLPQPVPATGLAEVIPLPATLPEVTAAGVALTARLGRVPLLVPGGPLAPRLRAAVLAEATRLVQAGQPPAALAAALRDFGIAGGLLAGVAPADTAGAPVLAERLAAVLAEAGAVLLSEGAAADPVEVDLAAIHGLGFPRWRGGPMFRAARRGAAALAADLGRPPAQVLARFLASAD